MSVISNRLILGGKDFDSKGIALVEKGSLQDRLGLAQEVQINGQAYTVNKQSTVEWLARTVTKLENPGRSTFLSIKEAIAQPGVDLGKILENRVAGKRLISPQRQSFQNSAQASAFFQREATQIDEQKDAAAKVIQRFTRGHLARKQLLTTSVKAEPKKNTGVNCSRLLITSLMVAIVAIMFFNISLIKFNGQQIQDITQLLDGVTAQMEKIHAIAQNRSS